MRVTYDERFFNDTDADLGDVWNAVGAIGASAVQLVPSLFGGGSSSAGGPARGLAAITAAVNQALDSLNQLLAAVRGGTMPAAAAVSEAQRIAEALSNPQFIYQAQRGNDAEVLRNGKTQAAAIVAQIQALAGNTTAGGAGVNYGGIGSPVASSGGTAANPLASAPASNGFAVDNSTLLLLGGGLALILLMK